MLESILLYMGNLDPALIYAVLFFFAFIENVFPPSPSDVVVVVGASLIATTSMGYVPVLLLTSFGSSLGFMLMYFVGKISGNKIMRSGRFSFITEKNLQKADKWFNRWGFKLILANRFLPGTRSVISFFAGVYELEVFKTFLFATISAFAWNALIIYAGMLLGSNVKTIDYYLSTYSFAGGIITVIVVAFLIIKHFFKKKNSEAL